MTYTSSHWNTPDYKGRRRELRKSATKAENALWERIRRKQLGAKFRRQFQIGPYVADFCCPRLRFIVEVDGDAHNEKKNTTQEGINGLHSKVLWYCGIPIHRFSLIWNGSLEISVTMYWNEQRKTKP